MMIAPVVVTKPHAGVITTRPATAPEQKPRTLGLPRMMYSAMAQTKRGDGGGERRGGEGVGGDAVGGERATGVEAVPADPEHAGADHAEHHAVRRHGLFAEAEALAEDQAEDQRRPAGGHVHHGAAGEVDRLDLGVRRSTRRS